MDQAAQHVPPATADEETDEGADDEVEEEQHRPIVPGLSDRESGFSTSRRASSPAKLGLPELNTLASSLDLGQHSENDTLERQRDLDGLLRRHRWPAVSDRNGVFDALTRTATTESRRNLRIWRPPTDLVSDALVSL